MRVWEKGHNWAHNRGHRKFQNNYCHKLEKGRKSRTAHTNERHCFPSQSGQKSIHPLIPTIPLLHYFPALPSALRASVWFSSALLTNPESAKWRLPARPRSFSSTYLSTSRWRGLRQSTSCRLSPSYVLILILLLGLKSSKTVAKCDSISTPGKCFLKPVPLRWYLPS